QRQRIALARALAVDPKVLLLDEPFGALDAKVRKELRRWLRRLHDELHVTSIFVTHDQEEALEVADRVVVMNRGRIEQTGTPQQVWEHPATPFVYGFLGDVNLLPGRASAGQMQTTGGWQIAAPNVADALDAEAMAFVRPSDLAVAPYVVGAPGLPARLDRALVVGPLARLELTPLEQPEQILEAHLPADEYRHLSVHDGATVLLSPRKARVFLQAADDPAAMI
ncbi:MAG: TOBE-like domain-containing protein, partial [Burkholderiaceae bacterium]|nr:TOBE-like domain-containing protein [Burkholderiaceae bacterium]